eukprot:TRINITY_DN20798_c0_g1_i1.p1 TRINITY_DN20798_c0_g1~~TRINITY_DN20798_c0_g1_i1.p1  ORF type:complete len:1194 (+),score=296.81 TRINITY_DN20798_c0_g1_i1:89-3670(+)
MADGAWGGGKALELQARLLARERQRLADGFDVQLSDPFRKNQLSVTDGAVSLAVNSGLAQIADQVKPPLRPPETEEHRRAVQLHYRAAEIVRDTAGVLDTCRPKVGAGHKAESGRVRGRRVDSTFNPDFMRSNLEKIERVVRLRGGGANGEECDGADVREVGDGAAYEEVFIQIEKDCEDAMQWTRGSASDTSNTPAPPAIFSDSGALLLAPEEGKLARTPSKRKRMRGGTRVGAGRVMGPRKSTASRRRSSVSPDDAALLIQIEELKKQVDDLRAENATLANSLENNTRLLSVAEKDTAHHRETAEELLKRSNTSALTVTTLMQSQKGFQAKYYRERELRWMAEADNSHQQHALRERVAEMQVGIDATARSCKRLEEKSNALEKTLAEAREEHAAALAAKDAEAAGHQARAAQLEEQSTQDTLAKTQALEALCEKEQELAYVTGDYDAVVEHLRWLTASLDQTMPVPEEVTRWEAPLVEVRRHAASLLRRLSAGEHAPAAEAIATPFDDGSDGEVSPFSAPATEAPRAATPGARRTSSRASQRASVGSRHSPVRGRHMSREEQTLPDSYRRPSSGSIVQRKPSFLPATLSRQESSERLKRRASAARGSQPLHGILRRPSSAASTPVSSPRHAPAPATPEHSVSALQEQGDGGAAPDEALDPPATPEEASMDDAADAPDTVPPAEGSGKTEAVPPPPAAPAAAEREDGAAEALEELQAAYGALEQAGKARDAQRAKEIVALTAKCAALVQEKEALDKGLAGAAATMKQQAGEVASAHETIAELEEKLDSRERGALELGEQLAKVEELSEYKEWLVNRFSYTLDMVNDLQRQLARGDRRHAPAYHHLRVLEGNAMSQHDTDANALPEQSTADRRGTLAFFLAHGEVPDDDALAASIREAGDAPASERPEAQAAAPQDPKTAALLQDFYSRRVSAPANFTPQPQRLPPRGQIEINVPSSMKDVAGWQEDATVGEDEVIWRADDYDSAVPSAGAAHVSTGGSSPSIPPSNMRGWRKVSAGRARAAPKPKPDGNDAPSSTQRPMSLMPQCTSFSGDAGPEVLLGITGGVDLDASPYDYFAKKEHANRAAVTGISREKALFAQFRADRFPARRPPSAAAARPRPVSAGAGIGPAGTLARRGEQGGRMSPSLCSMPSLKPTRRPQSALSSGSSYRKRLERDLREGSARPASSLSFLSTL